MISLEFIPLIIVFQKFSHIDSLDTFCFCTVVICLAQELLVLHQVKLIPSVLKVFMGETMCPENVSVLKVLVYR